MHRTPPEENGRGLILKYDPRIRLTWQLIYRARLQPAVSQTQQTRVCRGRTLCSFLPDTTRVNGFGMVVVVQRINIRRRHATPGLGEVRCPQHAHNATGNETCIAGELRGVPKNSRDQLTASKVHCRQQSHFELYFVLTPHSISSGHNRFFKKILKGPTHILS
jgi:hypothetical protein